MSEAIQKVGIATFISLFDATSGYWQTPIRRSDRWLTAFIGDEGLFEWTRTPFGMKSSGDTFVAAMKQILTPLQSCTASHDDDAAVYSYEWLSHLDHLDRFLSAIKASGITFKLKNANLVRLKFDMRGMIQVPVAERPIQTKLQQYKE